MKSSFAVPLAIIFGGAIIAIAVYMTIPKGDTSRYTMVSELRPVSASDHIFGNPAAKVKVIVYTDFECPYCQSFHNTLHQLLASEGASGEVAWVFRHFPLTEIHPNALTHALAAECAADVGGEEAFWKFADELFKHQPVQPSQYGTLAGNAGLSGSTFANCYATASATYTERVMQDRENALSMGADGTPFSVVLTEGKSPLVMDGAYNYDAAKTIIDEALGR